MYRFYDNKSFEESEYPSVSIHIERSPTKNTRESLFIEIPENNLFLKAVLELMKLAKNTYSDTRVVYEIDDMSEEGMKLKLFDIFKELSNNIIREEHYPLADLDVYIKGPLD